MKNSVLGSKKQYKYNVEHRLMDFFICNFIFKILIWPCVLTGALYWFLRARWPVRQVTM